MIKKQIAIDIETMADMEMINLLPEVEASKTLKDPEKIKADIEKKKAEQIEKMALNPLFGKIACISLFSEEEIHFLIGEEKDILKEFFDIIRDKQLITYNGINFDIPFIFKRAIKNNVKQATIPLMKIYTNKYNNLNHIDLMNEFCEWGKFEKLDLLAKVYLGDEKKDFDVKLIPELIKTEEGRKQLQDYCIQDTKLTWELAKKFGFLNNY